MRKVLPSELTNTIEQFMVYVHRNEAHFTYIMYIIPMYLRLTTFSILHCSRMPPPPTFTLPQMPFHLYFLQFLFRCGAPPMTLLTAGALTVHQLPSTASNVCTTDARLGGVCRMPPQSRLRRSPGRKPGRRFSAVAR